MMVVVSCFLETFGLLLAGGVCVLPPLRLLANGSGSPYVHSLSDNSTARVRIALSYRCCKPIVLWETREHPQEVGPSPWRSVLLVRTGNLLSLLPPISTALVQNVNSVHTKIARVLSPEQSQLNEISQTITIYVTYFMAFAQPLRLVYVAIGFGTASGGGGATIYGVPPPSLSFVK